MKNQTQVPLDALSAAVRALEVEAARDRGIANGVLRDLAEARTDAHKAELEKSLALWTGEAEVSARHAADLRAYLERVVGR